MSRPGRLDEREDKAVYYLNDEQFECLAPTDAPTLFLVVPEAEKQPLIL